MRPSRWKRACRAKHEARGFAREVYAGLGVTGKTPTQDDLDAIETWHEQGAGNELILLAVKAAHSKSGGREHGRCGQLFAGLAQTRPDHGGRRSRGFGANAHAQWSAPRNLRGGGHGKRPNAPDRDLLCRWAGEMGMTQELILLAAEYARAARAPR